MRKPFSIIKELRIQEIWESLGSTCNLVGSVKNGLLMTHLDIDFHTYSDDFSIAKSFEAIGMISENPRIKEVIYKNLLEAEDMCLEWHLTYEDDRNLIWTIDIIHIKNESPYAGFIEKVTDKIKAALTDKMKESILEIKWHSVENKTKAIGIEIYQAVIEDGVTSYSEFIEWQKKKKDVGISLWEPK